MSNSDLHYWIVEVIVLCVKAFGMGFLEVEIAGEIVHEESAS